MNHIHVSRNHSFHAQIVLNSILASLSSKARMFDATESMKILVFKIYQVSRVNLSYLRSSCIRYDPGVYCNHSKGKKFCHSGDSTNILGIDVGGKSDIAVVRYVNNLVFILKLEDWCNRTEYFLLCQLHVGVHICQNSRLNKVRT